MLLLQLQSGFRFPAKDLDLASMERLFKVLCARALRACKYLQDGKARTMLEIFRPATTVTLLRHILGHHRPGVCRRPQATDEHWAIIVAVCIKARQKCNTLMGFGQGFRLQLISGPGSLWQSHHITDMQATIAEPHPMHVYDETPATRAKYRVERQGQKCHFGHLTTSARRNGIVN